MCVLLYLLICTALRAHIIVVEVLYKIYYYDYDYYYCEQVLFVRFYSNPAPVIRFMQFHYCAVSNPGTGADDAFVSKRCVWRNATWPSHSRPAIAASARLFQICFSPLTF